MLFCQYFLWNNYVAVQTEYEFEVDGSMEVNGFKKNIKIELNFVLKLGGHSWNMLLKFYSNPTPFLQHDQKKALKKLEEDLITNPQLPFWRNLRHASWFKKDDIISAVSIFLKDILWIKSKKGENMSETVWFELWWGGMGIEKINCRDIE